jgi:MraZ protein
LLTGEYFHAIDAKFRLTVPAKFRDSIDPAEQGSGFYAVPGFDGVLFLYTPKTFRETSPQLENDLLAVPEVRNFRRLHYGLTEYVEVDRLGRVLIPEKTLRRCGIEKDVAIVGVRDHVEVWDRAKWEAFVAAQFARHDELAQQAMKAERSRPASQADSA